MDKALKAFRELVFKGIFYFDEEVQKDIEIVEKALKASEIDDAMSKKWFCSRINISDPYFNDVNSVCDECASIELSGYKVEQIVYIDSQYQIFYSRNEN